MRRPRPAVFFFAAAGSFSDRDEVDVIRRVCLPGPHGPGTLAGSRIRQLQHPNLGSIRLLIDLKQG